MAPTLSPISRKRNAAAGPLVLDRDALLSDKETPQTLVIEAAKSKPQVMIMLGEDEESHKYLYLQGISDRELADKISRSEDMLGTPSMFPDGGAKLRLLLNKQLAEREQRKLHKDFIIQGLSDKELADRISRAEGMLDKSSIFPDGGAKMRFFLNKQLAERERRKLHKADGNPTISKATLLANMPIHIDTIDDLTSRGTSPSVPASQSNFASCFCSKLDDNGPAKSFENEMSRTQKIGLSSSHTLFKSPSNLSDHTNDSSQPNREHFGRHSSTPSHRQPNKGVSGYFEKNKLGDKVQLPTSCLLNILENMGPILEPMTISEQAQFGTALLGRALDAFASAHGCFLPLETENKKLTQHNSVLVKDNKSFHAEVNSLKSALVAQTARAEAERDSWLKEKEALIAAHQAELDAVKEKSRAEGYEQGQDELKGLQRPFTSNASQKFEEE